MRTKSAKIGNKNLYINKYIIYIYFEFPSCLSMLYFLKIIYITLSKFYINIRMSH